MNPGAPVGMFESGTPGEPEGYEFVILLEVTGSVLLGAVFRRFQKARKCIEELA
jgi:hypothetical protein